MTHSAGQARSHYTFVPARNRTAKSTPYHAHYRFGVMTQQCGVTDHKYFGGEGNGRRTYVRWGRWHTGSPWSLDLILRKPKTVPKDCLQCRNEKFYTNEEQNKHMRFLNASLHYEAQFRSLKKQQQNNRNKTPFNDITKLQFIRIIF